MMNFETKVLKPMVNASRTIGTDYVNATNALLAEKIKSMVRAATHSLVNGADLPFTMCETGEVLNDMQNRIRTCW